jgi:hypothetical protein
MTRLFAIAIALICLCLGAFLLPVLSQVPDKAAPPKGAPATKGREETLALMRMLKQPIETKGLAEKVKLKVALEYFSDKFGGKLPILIDKAAFAAELADRIGRLPPNVSLEYVDPYEEEVSLPAVPTRMPMNTALCLILSQIGKGQATYLIRQGYVEIVPASHATAKRLLAQPVFTSFDQRPLLCVLTELSDQSGLTINIDPSAGKQASSLISATFRNTILEDTLVAVTEMAELKFVVFQNSVYVTTADKVQSLVEEERRRSEKRQEGAGAS